MSVDDAAVDPNQTPVAGDPIAALDGAVPLAVSGSTVAVSAVGIRLAVPGARKRRGGGHPHPRHLDRDPVLRVGQPQRGADARVAAARGRLMLSDVRRFLRGGLTLGAAGAGLSALAGCAGTLPPVDTSAEGFGEDATGTGHRLVPRRDADGDPGGGGRLQ